jgi:hypothetical protein
MQQEVIQGWTSSDDIFVVVIPIHDEDVFKSPILTATKEPGKTLYCSNGVIL